MRHLWGIAVASVSLAACATSSAPDMATSAFDYAPSSSNQTDTSRSGYSLRNEGTWAADLDYEDTRGEPLLALSFTSAGGDETGAQLSITMPYLQNGVRRFHGETDEGSIVEVELQAGPCRDPGSEVRYTYFAAISIDGQVSTGCGAEVAEMDRWSNYLMEYLPAIDLCLAEFGGRARHVSIAYPVSDGLTGVRLVDGTGQSWECITRDHDEAVNAMRPLDAADVIYGEGDPIFVRDEIPGFGEGCYVYEAVRDAQGHLIGSFGYDACGSGPDVAVG